MSGESGESDKAQAKLKNERKLSADSRNSAATASTKKKTLKKSSRLRVPDEKFVEEEELEASDPSSLSEQSTPPDEVEPARVAQSISEDLEGRGARRARGKSVYLSCFAGIDSIYFIIRLVVFIRVDIFHDAWVDKNGTINISKNTTNGSSTTETISKFSIDSNKYFCGDEALEAQCAWIFSVTWMCYFLANVSLIMSILWLSLKLCYAYVFLKTTSIIIHFLGLLTYGYHCLSQKFYIETGVFFIFHLPLQIFGTKRTKNYANSLKQAELEKAILARWIPTPTPNEKPTRSTSNIQKSKVLQRKKSYQVVTTVDE